MHKKIESELISLAHSILQMKNKEDVLALKAKAGELYEKLSVLAFVDRYVETEAKESKTQILENIAAMDKATSIEEELEVVELKTETETLVVEELEAPKEKQKKKKKVKKTKLKKEIKVEKIEEEVLLKEQEKDIEVKEGLFSVQENALEQKNTLEEELKDTISLDVTTDLFENAVRVETAPRKSLNDVLVRKNLQIGLNDRIAFVKHLFEGSQEDYNRVVSQLNSFKNEKEAIKFISKMVKLDYDWSGKEEYEERFISLITRKFA